MSLTAYTSGNFPTYRFYISEASSLTYEVFPLNFLSTSLIDSLASGQVFYRRVFSGKLLFGTNSKVIDEHGVEQNRQDDWDLFWGFEQHDPCAKLYFTITKNSVNIPFLDSEVYWEGYFSTTDGFIDIDKCIFEVTPKALDDYTDILDKGDLQYNILSTGTPVSTRAFVDGLIDVTYTRNRWLAKIGSSSVLEFLADKVKTGVTVSSDFFTAANNPATLNTNHLKYLTIAQKSDIIRPTGTAATSAMMSWNELMDILWAMFQVKWNYDSTTDTINVEHISWFPPAAGIDLRTQLMTVATNKYSYLKENMPKYEWFSFAEADDSNFVGTPIWYDSTCVNTDPETNVVETTVNVTTDLEYIISNPEAIEDEGFVILCNYLNATYFVDIQIGALDPLVVKLNMHLSWANLHHYYFRHNRVMISGYLNETLTNFWTAQKTKHQPCSAILCSEFDPSESITTELGEVYFGGAKAIVQRSEISPSGETKFNLLYGPADNANTGVDDTKVIYIIQEGANVCHATLTENADADLDLEIQETIYNDLCVLDCTGDVETWTIVTGSKTDTYTLVDTCHALPLPAGWSIELNFTAASIAALLVLGWNVIFVRDPTVNYHDICP